MLVRSTSGGGERFRQHGLPCREEAQAVHRGGHESHLQFMAAAGLGIMLTPEHAPRLNDLVARPIEGDPIKRSVELFVMAGRYYSPALNAFIKISRLRHWWGANPRERRVSEQAICADAAAPPARDLCQA